MRMKTIHTDKAPAAIGPYSQAVASGGLLFTAGQIALDPATGEMSTGDVREQTQRVLDNLEAVLQAGGASWDDVLKTTIFLADLTDFVIVNEIYGERLGGARPARSTVQVAALPRGGLVEIDAVARIST
jgi:2-iminobutanoate/2-iminopropanoate deaminase